MSLDFMDFDEGLLFHYTTFDSAKIILSTGTLLFGLAENMNDISEASKNVYGNLPLESIESELKKYQTLSFTEDSKFERGFMNDPLWGYYADKGYGVCLTFNKTKLASRLADVYPSPQSIHAPIIYRKYTGRDIFLWESETIDALKQEIRDNVKDIFYEKSDKWRQEAEYRFLIYKSDNPDSRAKLDISGCVVSAILCLPRYNNEEFLESAEYKALAEVTRVPILRYYQPMGGGILVDAQENALYPRWGEHQDIDV